MGFVTNLGFDSILLVVLVMTHEVNADIANEFQKTLFCFFVHQINKRSNSVDISELFQTDSMFLTKCSHFPLISVITTAAMV